MKALGRLPVDYGPILDAPAGFGRNALALAELGWDVVAVDKDADRLASIGRSAANRLHEEGATHHGKVVTACVDLTSNRLPFSASSFSAIICIHYPVQRIMSDLKVALKPNGVLYVETFQGQGLNYLELPKAGEISRALKGWEILIYRERAVGPPSERAVVVEAVARKNCDWR